jgi:hypothetical protein
MAALSPAQENALSLGLVIFLAALLALSLAAVITSPPQTGSPPAEAGDRPALNRAKRAPRPGQKLRGHRQGISLAGQEKGWRARTGNNHLL